MWIFSPITNPSTIQNGASGSLPGGLFAACPIATPLLPHAGNDYYILETLEDQAGAGERLEMMGGAIHMNHPATHVVQEDLPRAISAEDRRRAFAAARRHTLFIRLLNFLIPLGGLLIIAAYFLPTGKKSLFPDVPVSIDKINLDGHGLKMINPHYQGGSRRLGKYEVGAEYALQQISSPNVLELHKIHAFLKQKDGRQTTFRASKGIYDTSSEKLSLMGGIEISGNQGMAAKLQKADIDMKKRLLTSSSPVIARMGRNIIRGEGIIIKMAQKYMKFKGRVHVTLYRDSSMTSPPSNSGHQ